MPGRLGRCGPALELEAGAVVGLCRRGGALLHLAEPRGGGGVLGVEGGDPARGGGHGLLGAVDLGLRGVDRLRVRAGGESRREAEKACGGQREATTDDAARGGLAFHEVPSRSGVRQPIERKGGSSLQKRPSQRSHA